MELPDGCVFRRHIDNLRSRVTSSGSEEREEEEDDWLTDNMELSQTEENTVEDTVVAAPAPRRFNRNRHQQNGSHP